MLVRPLEEEIQQRQRRAADLQVALGPIQAMYEAHAHRSRASVTLLVGLPAIDAAVEEAATACKEESITVQPGGGRTPATLTSALERARALADRGVRTRTLYQHTVRHSAPTMAYIERMAEVGGIEFRTLDELFERLIIFDRTTAFVPARSDRQAALEIREPALVSYLAGVFGHAWDRATPLNEPAGTDPTPGDPIPEVQRSIARLLVEGFMDESIARRLGMSVRTCRAHIAKLATHLGSTNRTQLGYLIATSPEFSDGS
ncbi:LuxR C-terminal-related transcriptional regulator [Streptomyces sp. RKAG293]|uniref:helix-turn-helix transcriptional regulator n=1 Tax=Streptomyces sp. RKAG293 TaxID=2893403 RepID=UPI0020343157|nr:LuxR C-terminal-related transcriptional regulator [Streptomyces sp. RKAG293]MCM2420614.1 LuxR C-terminal-related transcriptional regulator [Streptomyces sp. RKAG293]